MPIRINAFFDPMGVTVSPVTREEIEVFIDRPPVGNGLAGEKRNPYLRKASESKGYAVFVLVAHSPDSLR